MQVGLDCQIYLVVRAEIFIHLVYRRPCWLSLAIGFSCTLLAHCEAWDWRGNGGKRWF